MASALSSGDGAAPGKPCGLMACQRRQPHCQPAAGAPALPCMPAQCAREKPGACAVADGLAGPKQSSDTAGRLLPGALPPAPWGVSPALSQGLRQLLCELDWPLQGACSMDRALIRSGEDPVASGLFPGPGQPPATASAAPGCADAALPAHAQVARPHTVDGSVGYGVDAPRQRCGVNLPPRQDAVTFILTVIHLVLW